jgi:hypothetical protein
MNIPMKHLQLFIKIFSAVIIVLFLAITLYWGYFHMRYKVIQVGEYHRPVLYDTWTNKFGLIEIKEDKAEPSAPPQAAPAPAPEAQ